MPSPSLRPQLRAHFDFSALPDVMVRESFARLENGGVVVYAGVSWGAWQADEIVWNERDGRWSSFTPEPREDKFTNPEDGAQAVVDARNLRTIAALLDLQGANLEIGGDFDAEPILRVASGAPLVASSSLLYEHPAQDYFPSVAIEWRLYNAATGTEYVSGAPTWDAKADGSYLLWANTGAEWSAIRVQIGAGAWATNPAIYPGPGCPLYRKDAADPELVMAVNNGNAFTHQLAFDPLARAVSASCVLHSDIRSNDGQFDVPVGSLILAGIRASRSGPQSALWVLRADGTARLLAASPTFSDGRCECAKTNHHASDVGQAPDGRLFLLSECNLSVYNPDAGTPWNALRPFPLSTEGHPGGQCLRFAGNDVNFFTENFGGVNDGAAWYNRLVRRVAGRDLSGPSTLWHGPNCFDNYQNTLWGVRGETTTVTGDAISDANAAKLYLDRIQSGRWAHFDGLSRDTLAVSDNADAGLVGVEKWQRLRAVGSALWVFGWRLLAGAEAGDETPVCLVTGGQTLDYVKLPFFVRRATPRADSLSLFLCARAESDGIGIANRVVEIVTARTHICSFWNDTDKAFAMSRAAFTDLGGDAAKLPAFFVWFPQSGRDGGGVWKAATAAPTTGFWLQTEASETAIVFGAQPGGALPYGFAFWGRLCFDIDGDGGIVGPFIEPTCEDAQCVITTLPAGTKFRVMERLTPDAATPIAAFQINDLSDAKRLSDARDLAPTLWYRVDSTAPRNDLTTYTHLAPFGRLIVPDVAASQRVEAVVLVAPDNQPVRLDELPQIQRRA